MPHAPTALLLNLLAPPALAQDLPPEPAPPAPAARPDGTWEGRAVSLEGDRLLLELTGTGLYPGGLVAVYVEERRPDPRGGEVVGLRYAGDARLSWVGEGLVELALAEEAQSPASGRVILGPPRGLEPTPPWAPPAPPAPLAVAQVETPEAPAERPHSERRALKIPGLGEDLDGSPLGSVHDGQPSSQAILSWGGYAADGYGTGAGTGGLAWRLRPAKGPGLVEVGLEGLRGRHWVEGDEDDETWATEPVAGAWLWTRLDTAGVGLAGIFGAGLGVDAEGPTMATLLGLRSGLPDRSRVELLWEHRGRLGDRLDLDGRVALADPLRVGMRARLGDMPLHEGDLRQRRADGALLLSWDPVPRLTLTVAGGLGAYDLLWADAGPVADGALELRW